MAKYNKPTRTQTQTTNLAGGKAFLLDPKTQLATLMVTSFLKKQFYRDEDAQEKELIRLIYEIPDKQFIAKAAIYSRYKMGMRRVSHVVGGEIVETIGRDEGWLSPFFNQIVRRLDDMLEILAYRQKFHGFHPLPNSMKRGFRKAFDKFDKYQLAKYQARDKSISLVDVMNLVRPRPNFRNAEALKLMAKDELRSTETWEAKLSQAGKEAKTEEEKQEKKQQAWSELIDTGKIGYLALVRNLRNILDTLPDGPQGDELITKVCDLLCDEKRIKGSNIFPYQILYAISILKHKEIPNDTRFGGYWYDTRPTYSSLADIEKLYYSGKLIKVLSALKKALEISCNGCPSFDGHTLIALDVSGSMKEFVGYVGCLFAAVLFKTNVQSVILTFDVISEFNIVDPTQSVADIAQRFWEILLNRGHGTNFECIFTKLNASYDRIIIISDMQGWVANNPAGRYDAYCKRVGVRSRIFSFDMNGHGTVQFPQNNVYLLAGYSANVFDVLKQLDQDPKALVHEIEQVDLFLTCRKRNDI